MAIAAVQQLIGPLKNKAIAKQSNRRGSDASRSNCPDKTALKKRWCHFLQGFPVLHPVSRNYSNHLVSREQFLECVRCVVKLHQRQVLERRNIPLSQLMREICEAGDVETLKCLLNLQRSVATAVLDQGATPLHVAAKNGQANVVSLLLSRLVDVNAAQADQGTALHLAAGSGHVGVVQLLLHAKAKVTAPNAFGSTPLHQAAEAGNVECARALLVAGASGSELDQWGRTPLLIAAMSNHVEVMVVMVQSGRDCGLDVAARGGVSPREYLVANGADNLASVLDRLSRGVSRSAMAVLSARARSIVAEGREDDEAAQLGSLSVLPAELIDLIASKMRHQQ